ncbi:hypothetical protein HS1genome_1505 [Sulfodiicoccus acidiphilus]|uniref:Carotenoid biosynthesis protein n=1 Tax=Sulfodiicoccus acidiphilus TaxID=1670455 RepID=A0A348B4L4_9CREN|nr:carotenoid biosynthesis protein [Sulfodiicoccus acidiphilus]BBD73116.1 hypothetical protein HS1genome_1505 [Sulfodiicoccus acidiphilus]GGU00676.1 hypothetical protein GCM10007116_17410 [Sulfodiicoccus acidiphilus]
MKREILAASVLAVGEVTSLPAFLVLGPLAVVLVCTVDRRLWKVPVTAALVGFLAELAGTRTGVPFGPYHYNSPFTHLAVLGVPLPVVDAWSVFLLTSYLASAGVERQSWIVGALLATLLDLSVDPVMVSAGFWSWRRVVGPTWFGVPWTNYVGWFIVSLLALRISRTRNLKVDARPFVFPYLALPMSFAVSAKPQLREPLYLAAAIVILSIVFLWLSAYKRGG